jgi:NADP-dependent 3-hydroxy acid dehydrogenase YdfG
VNFAGTAGHKLGHQEIWEIDEKEYDFIMDVKVKGLFSFHSEALKPYAAGAGEHCLCSENVL